uniref:Putative ovule protein n=1 Tax=Solanum chacoense TaxID=4108 RepID=A0A0V0H2W0_SOLCH
MVFVSHFDGGMLLHLGFLEKILLQYIRLNEVYIETLNVRSRRYQTFFCENHYAEVVVDMKLVIQQHTHCNPTSGVRGGWCVCSLTPTW